MEVSYTKEETIKLLEEYYRRLEGRQVKVNVKVEKGSIGYYETEGCITTFYTMDKMEIAGIEKEVMVSISESDIEKYLGALFQLYGLDVRNLYFNSGLTTRSEGYGMCEHDVRSPYFKGITLYLAKDNVKGLKKVVQE